MDPMHVLAMVCFYGPTPLAGILAGWQALQCPSPWQSFAVGLIGTVALAVVFGVAADYLPNLGTVIAGVRAWQFHLMVSPFVGLPLGLFCAISVHRRRNPPPPPPEG